MSGLRDVMAEFGLSGFVPAIPMGDAIVDLRRELRETYDRLATAELERDEARAKLAVAVEALEAALRGDGT